MELTSKEEEAEWEEIWWVEMSRACGLYQVDGRRLGGSGDEGSPLLVVKKRSASARSPLERGQEKRMLISMETKRRREFESVTHSLEESLEEEEGREDGETEGGPVDERVASLVGEDGPQRPADDGRSGDVSLVGLERVSDGGRLEEEQAEEDEHLGSDAGVVVDLPAERLEPGQDDEDESPGVVEREGEVDEDWRRRERDMKISERTRCPLVDVNLTHARRRGFRFGGSS